MRLVGYDRAPARLPRSSGAPAPSPEALADRARDLLAALGLHEIVSWGFVPRGWLAPLGDAALAEGVVVKNPISADYEVMRTSLLPGAGWTRPGATSRAACRTSALFEVGPGRLARGRRQGRAAASRRYAAAILVGRRADWLKPGEPLSISSTASASPSSCCAASGSRRRASCPCARRLLHPGVGAAIHVDGRRARPSGRSARFTRASRARWASKQRAVYLEVDARRRRGAPAADPQRAAPALPGRHARRLVLDRRGGHRRRAARGAERRRRSRCCATWPCWRTTAIPVRAGREEGDALDADLSRRRSDADRRGGRRRARARRRWR